MDIIDEENNKRNSNSQDDNDNIIDNISSKKLRIDQYEKIANPITNLMTDPVTTDPVTTDPVTTDPVTTDPVTTDPVTTDPVTTDPVESITNPIDRNYNNLREWSLSAQSSNTSTIYKVTAYLGDPRVEIEGLKSLSKDALIQRMRQMRCSAAEIVGTKQVLLNNINKKASVQFVIDSRESIQRVLVVALDKFNNDHHLYRVKMPKRGTHTFGLNRYENDDKFDDFFEMFSIFKFRSREDIQEYLSQSNIPKRTWFKNLGDNDDERWEILNGFVNGLITKNAFTNKRTVFGEANFLKSRVKLSDDDFDCSYNDDDDVLGVGSDRNITASTVIQEVLSLHDTALLPGDFLQFDYDFGSTTKFFMRVDEVKTQETVLPENKFCGRHQTRAEVVKVENLHRVFSQY